MAGRAGHAVKQVNAMVPYDDDINDRAGDDIERLLRLAGARERPDPLSRDTARVAVRAAWRASTRARTRRRWLLIGGPALAAAAASVLAIVLWRAAPSRDGGEIVAHVITSSGAGGAVRIAAGRNAVAGDALRAGDVVDTAAGVVAAFALEGGGTIRQNADTRLRWTARRQVALDTGHIYVDSDGAGDPIVIVTAAGVVRDIGTRFDVRVRDGEVRVRVREGAVRMDTGTASRDARAGRALVARAGAIEEQATSTVGDDWDWIARASGFRLQGARLETFVAWVEEESGRQVEFRPDSLRAESREIVLQGSVAGLSILDALEAVLPAAGLTHRMTGERILIERSPERIRP